MVSCLASHKPYLQSHLYQHEPLVNPYTTFMLLTRYLAQDSKRSRGNNDKQVSWANELHAALTVDIMKLHRYGRNYLKPNVSPLAVLESAHV